MGLLNKIAGGIGKAFKAVTGIADMVSKIFNSPLGNLLKIVFPPAAAIGAASSFTSMLGGLAQGVGGGHDYY